MAFGFWSCSAIGAPGRAAEQHVLSADGVPLAFEERMGQDPLLVFVHGWCGERGFWRSTMDALAPRHRCLALDLAGHGAAGAGRSRWTLDSLAEDVVAVVTASGTERVILIGHSMGAPVSLLAAQRLAPRVLGVIAVDSLHDADFAYPPGFLEEVAVALEADFPRALEASLRGVLGPTASPDLLGWIESRAMRTNRTAALALLRGLEGFELASALGAAGVPIRVINAAPGQDPRRTTNIERNRALADYDAAYMEGVGHFPMLEQPERFQMLLEHWLAELGAPSATTR